VHGVSRPGPHGRDPLRALRLVGIGVFCVLALCFLLAVREVFGPQGADDPEANVRLYLESVGIADAVSVRDCGYSEDPEGSVFTYYWCDLDASRPVRVPLEITVPEGRSIYCFSVSKDYPAYPLEPAWQGERRCFH
jgi:hypothetical protein